MAGSFKSEAQAVPVPGPRGPEESSRKRRALELEAFLSTSPLRHRAWSLDHGSAVGVGVGVGDSDLWSTAVPDRLSIHPPTGAELSFAPNFPG